MHSEHIADRERWHTTNANECSRERAEPERRRQWREEEGASERNPTPTSIAPQCRQVKPLNPTQPSIRNTHTRKMLKKKMK